jgi:hypothetical protein
MADTVDPATSPQVIPSLAILAAVLLATWYFFGGRKPQSERAQMDKAFGNGNATKTNAAVDLGSTGRDFVAAMAQAVSSRLRLRRR